MRAFKTYFLLILGLCLMACKSSAPQDFTQVESLRRENKELLQRLVTSEQEKVVLQKDYKKLHNAAHTWRLEAISLDIDIEGCDLSLSKQMAKTGVCKKLKDVNKEIMSRAYNNTSIPKRFNRYYCMDNSLATKDKPICDEFHQLIEDAIRELHLNNKYVSLPNPTSYYSK